MHVVSLIQVSKAHHGMSTSSAEATLIADTTQPSRSTMPSQHQPPTNQILFSPFLQEDCFSSRSGPARFSPNKLLTTRLLRGVRRARGKFTDLSTFGAEEISVNGQVFTVAPDAWTCMDSVCACRVEVRKCIVCAALVCFDANPFAV